MAVDNNQSQDVDLERTDRLPVIQGAVFDEEDADDESVIDYSPIVSTKGDFSRPTALDLPSLAESVRSVEERIARQNAEYEALTRSYEKARDAEAAAVAKATAVANELSNVRTMFESEQARARDFEKALAEKNAAFEAARSRMEETLREAERHQSEARTLRDTLSAREASIAQTLHSLGERDAQLSALQREHAQVVPALEERSRAGLALEGELKSTKEVLAAMAKELTNTQQSVIELTTRVKTNAEELTATRRELQGSQTLAATYLEQLRTREWRRGFDQNLYRELDAKIGAVQDDRGTLQVERDQLRDRVADLEAKLAAREEAIAKLQSAAANDDSLRKQNEQKVREVEEARAELLLRIGELEGERNKLMGEVSAREEKLSSLQTAAAESDKQRASQEQKLRQGDDARAELTKKISSLEGSLSRLNRDLAERDETITKLKASTSTTDAARAKQELVLQQVERACADLRDQVASLEKERKTLNAKLAMRDQAVADAVDAGRQQAQQSQELLAAAQKELAAVQASTQKEQAALQAAAQKEQAAAQAAAQKEQAALNKQIQSLQAELKKREDEKAALATQLQDAKKPLEPIEAEVGRLKEELTAKTATIEQINEEVRGLRSALERARGALEEREFLIRRLERSESANANVLGRIQTSIERLGSPSTSAGTAAAPVECVAELIRTDAGHNTSHVLGRRTRIGRAAGCELQIESSSVSRHHALLLMSTRDVIVEDLNSTNGVLVNGRKVSRHLLSDGDVITIGDAQFRLSVKFVPRTIEAQSTPAVQQQPATAPASDTP